MTHEGLIKIGVKWLQKSYAACAPYGHSSMTVIVTELVTGMEIPDVLGFSTSRGITVLLEAKTSRSDFLKELKDKPFRNPSLEENGMGSQRWYIAPAGIIPVELLPPKWGLLEYEEKKDALKISRRSEIFKKNDVNEMRILCSVLCRLKLKETDEHVAIRVYEDLGSEAKKKAAVFIDKEQEEK